MSTKVAASRFMLSSLRAGFYQQIVRDISGFEELGQKLIREAEIAQAFRQVSRLEEIGSILCNLPIKEYQLIGQYYKGLCVEFIGGNARSIFERVTEESRSYKSRGLMAIAMTEAKRGNYDEEFRWFTEASKTANNPSLIVEISRGMAVVRAKEGDHKQAIKEFERIFPLVKYAAPKFYYQFLNSFAVELAEVGRIEEARNISNIVLASDYAFAYPEWRETREDIERKGYRSSRSFVPIIQGATHNVVRLPEREYTPVSQDEPGRVLHFMVKKDKNDTPEIPKDASVADMIIMVMNLMSKEGNATDEKMRQLLEYATKLFSK